MKKSTTKRGKRRPLYRKFKKGELQLVLPNGDTAPSWPAYVKAMGL